MAKAVDASGLVDSSAKVSPGPQEPEPKESLAGAEQFVVVLVPEQPFKVLTEAAKREGMTLSEAFGRAIGEWVASRLKAKGEN